MKLKINTKKLEKLLALHVRVAHIAKQLGVNRSTIYNYCKRHGIVIHRHD